MTKKGLYYLAFAAPMGAILLFTEEKGFSNAELQALDRAHVNFIDRPAINHFDQRFNPISDYTNALLLYAPLTLGFEKRARRDWFQLSLMYLEFRVLEKTLAGTTKILFKRPRPYTYNRTGKVNTSLQKTKRAQRSFVSGHAVTAFGSAVFGSTLFSDYFPNSPVRPYVWGGSLLLATSSAVYRYLSGYHFPTDLMAGAALGAFIGWIIPALNKNPAGTAVRVYPFHGQSQGFILAWTF
jgi:membrane-associated phospholipid phosphatase